jgi:hypothetical protein
MDGIEKQNEELRYKLSNLEEENHNLKRYNSATRIMVDIGESPDPPFWHINISPEKIYNRKLLQVGVREEILALESWEHVEAKYLRIEMVRYYADYTQRIWSIIMERDIKKDKLWRYTEHAVYTVKRDESNWGKPVDWMNVKDTI